MGLLKTFSFFYFQLFSTGGGLYTGGRLSVMHRYEMIDAFLKGDELEISLLALSFRQTHYLPYQNTSEISLQPHKKQRELQVRNTKH